MARERDGTTVGVIPGRHSHPRLLIIGFGTRGRQWHEACRKRRDLVVAGVVDPAPSAADHAERVGLRHWSTLTSALEAQPDVAIVASPPAAHAADGLEVLEAGCPVLVEKPVALTVEDATTLLAGSERANTPALAAQNFRFLRRERALRKVLADDFGPILSTNVVSARPSSAAAPHLAQLQWGPVWDICLHHLDALRVRLGSLPAIVRTTVREPTATGSRPRTRYRIELDWRDGRSVVYEHTEGAPGFFHFEWLEGTERGIVVNDQEVATVFPSARPRRVRIAGGPAPEQALLDALLEALGTGEAGSLGIDDNLATIGLVEAVVRSAELDRAVTLTDPAGVAVAERAV